MHLDCKSLECLHVDVHVHVTMCVCMFVCVPVSMVNEALKKNRPDIIEGGKNNNNILFRLHAADAI